MRVGINKPEEIVRRVMEDRNKIRAEYGLPNRLQYDQNPREYLNLLFKITQSHKIIVRNGTELQKFFDDNQGHNAVFVRDENTIYNRQNLDYIDDEYEFMKNVFILNTNLFTHCNTNITRGCPMKLRNTRHTQPLT